MAEIGFNSQNCLVWPFSFQAETLSSSGKVRNIDAEGGVLQGLNRKVINASSLRVIIAFGPNAETCAVLPHFHCQEIRLGGFTYSLFLEANDTGVQRVYLRCRVSYSSLFLISWDDATEVSLAIKFAMAVTKTPGILPYAHRARHALSEIVIRNSLENQGQAKMTPLTMSDNIRAWLVRKGFTTMKDYECLTNLAGSFSKGVLLAACTSAIRSTLDPSPAGGASAPGDRVVPRPEVQPSARVFTPEQLDQIKSIHLEKEREIMGINSGETSTGGHFDDDNEGDIIDETHPTDFFEENFPDPVAADRVIKDALPDGICGMVSEAARSRKSKRQLPPGQELVSTHCWWCRKVFGSGNLDYPCWYAELCERICHGCWLAVRNGGYLPITKTQIMHLEIRCGCCQGLFGPKWSIPRDINQPACSPECLRRLRHGNSQLDRRNAAPRGATDKRYQDDCDDRPTMYLTLRSYFRDVHGIESDLKAVLKKKDWDGLSRGIPEVRKDG